MRIFLDKNAFFSLRFAGRIIFLARGVYVCWHILNRLGFVLISRVDSSKRGRHSCFRISLELICVFSTYNCEYGVISVCVRILYVVFVPSIYLSIKGEHQFVWILSWGWLAFSLWPHKLREFQLINHLERGNHVILHEVVH